MNYCTIEDAWGKSNNVSEQFKEHMTNTSTFQPIIKESCTISTKNNNLNLNNHMNVYSECQMFMNHIKNCRQCYNKLKFQFRPKIIETFQDLVDENRDIIVIILIGISILLFLNLVNNVTK